MAGNTHTFRLAPDVPAAPGGACRAVHHQKESSVIKLLQHKAFLSPLCVSQLDFVLGRFPVLPSHSGMSSSPLLSPLPLLHVPTRSPLHHSWFHYRGPSSWGKHTIPWAQWSLRPVRFFRAVHIQGNLFFLLFKKKFANVDCIPKHNFSACQATKSLSFYFCLPRTPPLHQWPRKKILTCHIHSTYIYIALHFKKEDCYSLFPFQANPLQDPNFSTISHLLSGCLKKPASWSPCFHSYPTMIFSPHSTQSDLFFFK